MWVGLAHAWAAKILALLLRFRGSRLQVNRPVLYISLCANRFAVAIRPSKYTAEEPLLAITVGGCSWSAFVPALFCGKLSTLNAVAVRIET